MDPMAYLSFCILFMSWVVVEPGANGMNVSLTVLNRTVQEHPQVMVVQDKIGRALPNIKGKRAYSSRSANALDGTTLRWASFQNPLPKGAVSFWNGYAKRSEYPCVISDCTAGIYTPSKGPYCFYAHRKREHKSSQFKILINDYDFELLSWKRGSYGRVPSNSVNTCPGVSIYVGKNKYGLGKVDSNNKAFYVVKRGRKYRRRWYDVLTINKDYRSQNILITKYHMDQAEYGYENLVLVSSKLSNNDCMTVKKTTQLSGSVSTEHRWDVSISLSKSVNIGMTAQIPRFGISWGFSMQKTFQWSKGHTEQKSSTYSDTVLVEVPPNHVCELAMEGKRMKAKIPFTAKVTRTYHDGKEQSATVKGVSHNAVVADIRIVVKRCRPIPDARPCPRQAEA